ncbi:G-protein coupled receptor 98 [Bienertia sinuspersici]
MPEQCVCIDFSCMFQQATHWKASEDVDSGKEEDDEGFQAPTGLLVFLNIITLCFGMSLYIGYADDCLNF